MEPQSQTSIRRLAGKRGESRPNPIVLFLLATFPLLLLEFVPVPILTNFEWAVYDQRLRLRNRLDPRQIDSTIRLVGVSAADEERLDSDLHNRQAYMELMALLRQWQAEAVVYDLFFDRELSTDQLFASALAAGPRATLAFSLLRQRSGFEPAGELPEEFAEAAQLASTGNDPDEIGEFIRAVDGFLFELRAEERSTPRDEAHGADLAELRRLIAWSREIRDRLQDRWLWLTAGRPFEETPGGEPFSADHLRRLAPSVLLGAPSHGFANIEKERQDVVRMAPLVYHHRGRLFPQLSLAAALAYFDVPFSEVEIAWGRYLRFMPRRNGDGEVVLPIDDRGRYLINFREGEAYLNRQPTLSAVLLPELRSELFPEGPEANFRGAIVIVGEVISGGLATDVEPIPLQTQFPMVGIHANILDNILRRDVLLLAPWWAGLLVALVLGGAAALAYHRYRFMKASFVTAGVLVIYLMGEIVLFIHGGLVLNVVKPVLGLAVGGLLLFGYVIGAKDRDRRLVRDVFLKSVSPRIGEEILNHYNDEAIWGARREITVLFIDVRGYTTISEGHPPEAVLSLLDRFYDTVSEAVFANEGQVNKFMGDAVLALFGALPEEPANHAERAVRAAVQAQEEIRRWSRSESMLALGVPFDTGAGVNTGEATVGLVGKRRIRIEYTALGDAVNTASRLQTAAGTGEVIIGERTMAAVGGPKADIWAQLDLVVAAPEELNLKGKAHPIQVHRVKIAGSLQKGTEL